MAGLFGADVSSVTEPNGSGLPSSPRYIEMSVPVLCRKGEAILTCIRKTNCIMLQRSGRSGNFVNILSIHARNIINIETPEDAMGRQIIQRNNDVWSSVNLSTFLKSRESSFSKRASTQSVDAGSPNSRTPSGVSFATCPHSRSSSGMKSGSLLPLAGTLYRMYYVKDASRSVRHVSMMEFSSLPDLESERKTKLVVRGILETVYSRGEKSLLFFVSPSSGSGNALDIFRFQVLPVLRFSRHEVNLIVTEYARHCEDYIADVRNDITDRHVLVAVGGDGIIHEIVNGIVRRWRAILNADSSAKEEEGTGVDLKTPFNTKVQGGKKGTCHVRRHMNDGELDSVSNGTKREGGNVEEEANTTKKGCADGKRGDITEQLGLGPSVLSKLASNAYQFPMIATIPAGSGCGIAWTLNISTIYQSVLALVHLETSVRDVMGLQYVQHACDCRKESGALHANCNTGKMCRTDGMDVMTKDPSTVLDERVSSMTITFGLTNDIDRGSEKLRWMRGSRFAAYSIFMLLRGLRIYRARMRYLPWTGHRGQQLLKTRRDDLFPSEVDFPRCTLTNGCSHCRLHGMTTPSSRFSVDDAKNGCASCYRASNTSGYNQTNLQSYPKDQEVDFDDDSLPWLTLDGGFYNIFISNVRYASKNVMMTPFAHLSDGAIDVMYSMCGNSNGGRVEFFNFFRHLETGSHVKMPSVSYLKVRAIELEALEGNIMSDGEFVPYKKVRVTSVRRAFEFVCGT